MLYELALSIGQSLDIEKNCATFLRTLMTRKRLSYAAVWLKGSLFPDSGGLAHSMVRIYAVPIYHFREAFLPYEHETFERVRKDGWRLFRSGDPAFAACITEQHIDGGTFILIPLGDIGVLKLYSLRDDYSFSDYEMNQLRSVLGQFATSLLSCIHYQRLQYESGQRQLAEAEIRRARDELEVRVQERTAELSALNQRLEAELSNRKQAEEQLRYLSQRDALTGVYNRHQFELALRSYDGAGYAPVGIIVLDVDGLKLINDCLGHDAGDELLAVFGSILAATFTRNALVARIGGDEFCVVLPKVHAGQLERHVRQIRGAVMDHNEQSPQLPLSVSVGMAVGPADRGEVERVFKDADDQMYREKRVQSSGIRTFIIQSMMRSMEALDYFHAGHADRVEVLVRRLAEAWGLNREEIDDVRLFARFHDIGKVGIREGILMKAGILSPDEWNDVRRHPEIGYRIAQSVSDLMPIADWILKHHERWDGQGYPFGLQGEEIPLECRLFAVAEAYEVMTTGRPYAPKRTPEEAQAILAEQSGRQFDPAVVALVPEILAAWRKI